MFRVVLKQHSEQLGAPVYEARGWYALLYDTLDYVDECIEGSAKWENELHTQNSSNYVLSSIPVFSLYPNPTTGSATIMFKGIGRDDLKLKVFNLTGQLLSEERINSVNSYTFDISRYNENILLIRLCRNNETLYLNKLVTLR